MLLMLTLPFSLLAQEEFQFAHYSQNKLFFNPAYAGSTPYMELKLLHRMQWQGVEGAPRHSIATAHTPLNYSHVGLGMMAYNYKFGVETDNAFYLSYAYHLKIGDKSKLSMGLQAGIINKQVRWSDLVLHDINDPEFPTTDISAMAPNFGLGFYFYSPSFHLGLSAPHLLSNPLPTSESISDNFTFDGKKIIFYLNSGIKFPVSSVLDLEPSLLIKSSVVATTQFSGNISFSHENGLKFGAGVHSEDAWVLMLGYRFTPKLGFSYSYGHALARAKAPGTSNHEFILNYNLSLRKNQITSPRYF